MDFATIRAPEVVTAGSVIYPAQLQNLGLCMHRLPADSPAMIPDSRGSDFRHLVSASPCGSHKQRLMHSCMQNGPGAFAIGCEFHSSARHSAASDELQRAAMCKPRHRLAIHRAKLMECHLTCMLRMLCPLLTRGSLYSACLLSLLNI